MKHEFDMKLQRYTTISSMPKSSTHAQNIYKQLLQNQEALESSTIKHMHSHKRHGIQVVHSQPLGVCFLHNLSLFTASFLVSQARPTGFRKGGRIVHTVKPYPVHQALPFFAEVGLACETCLDPR